MYEKIDKKIMEQAKNSIVQPSENYDARVNQVLSCLPETTTKIIRMSTWQRVAATIAVCLLSISSCVVAANYMVSERLQNMSVDEVAGYRLNEQNTTANADSFSRTLTKTEEQRLAQLQEAYTMEGEFPVSQLQTVVGLDDIEIDRMCYVITDSLFYFPERELKDEELLQYIDFCTKRDYSIAKTWQESTEAQAEQSLSVQDASQAVNKSIDLVKKVFGVDVSGDEYSLEWLNKNDESAGLFFLSFICDEVVTYTTIIDAESGHFRVQIMGKGTESEELQIDEESYKNNYRVIRELLRESFNVQESDIKETLLSYQKSNVDMLVNGVITYVVELNDNTKYVVRYSAESWECIIVDFYGEDSGYDDLMKGQIETAKKESYTLCVIPLEVE